MAADGAHGRWRRGRRRGRLAGARAARPPHPSERGNGRSGVGLVPVGIAAIASGCSGGPADQDDAVGDEEYLRRRRQLARDRTRGITLIPRCLVSRDRLLISRRRLPPAASAHRLRLAHAATSLALPPTAHPRALSPHLAPSPTARPRPLPPPRSLVLPPTTHPRLPPPPHSRRRPPPTPARRLRLARAAAHRTPPHAASASSRAAAHRPPPRAASASLAPLPRLRCRCRRRLARAAASSRVAASSSCAAAHCPPPRAASSSRAAAHRPPPRCLRLAHALPCSS
ncbi:hypothetical protein [Oryza sativa Japonica Group]|uniref:Uncharacterized protein n=1 Tax=Oryza sativa subsp. japonica TaxID=39947 RepID=Q5N8E6_ORYSJ|nr:hypothetical protein [Oryza sativa Japonica Group]BAD82260.1 hypothetical protein [Oryza sativa Japonica Group]